MFDGENRITVRAEDAAKLFSVSKSHWWAMNSAGRIPRPSSLGGATFWVVDELRRWAAAGCPERGKWEVLDARQASG